MSHGKYKAYPEYKDSGVEWIQSLPSSWELRKAKYLFKRVQRSAKESDGIVTAFRDGQVTLRSNRREDGFTNALKEIGYQGVRKGDLLVHAMDGFAGAIGVSDSDGKCSPVCSVCVPNDENIVCVRYYGYLVRQLAVTDFIASLAKGIRERSTEFRYSEFSSLELALPSLPEQIQIAKFLDHETAKIDRLIEKQEELIRLLKEKRQAVISHAVTRGLNPDVPLKDSGIEWLGQVPEHWVVLQFKFVIKTIEQGKSPECEARLAALNEWGVLKSGCVNHGIFNPNEHKALPLGGTPTVAAEVKEGDLLMSRASGSRDLIGSVAVVQNVRSKLMLSDKIFRLKVEESIDACFVRYLAASAPIRYQIELSINGAQGLANNITKESIGQLIISLPPKEEQKNLVKNLEKYCAGVDILIQSVEEEIMLLRERKSSLISAAVTGKIDVRTFKAF